MERRPFEPAPPPQQDENVRRYVQRFFATRSPTYRPWVSRGLIALCGLVYVAQMNVPGLTEAWAVDPARVREGAWWLLFTGALVHGSPMHILVNGYSGWVLGSRIEAFIGPWRMLVLSLVSLLASGITITVGGTLAELVYGLSGGRIALHSGLTVGFSGVLYGWLGSWLGFSLTSRFPGLKLSGRQLSSYIQMLVLNLAISLMPGVSLLAHLGGFTGGVLAALVLGLGQERDLDRA